jgi:hypothetical protein
LSSVRASYLPGGSSSPGSCAERVSAPQSVPGLRTEASICDSTRQRPLSIDPYCRNGVRPCVDDLWVRRCALLRCFRLGCGAYADEMNASIACGERSRHCVSAWLWGAWVRASHAHTNAHAQACSRTHGSAGRAGRAGFAMGPSDRRAPAPRRATPSAPSPDARPRL